MKRKTTDVVIVASENAETRNESIRPKSNKAETTSLARRFVLHVYASVPNRVPNRHWSEFVYNAVMNELSNLPDDHPLKRLKRDTVSAVMQRGWQARQYRLSDIFEALVLIRELPLPEGEKDTWAATAMREIATQALREVSSATKRTYIG